MTTEDMDTIIHTLEGYYPGKFSEFTTAEMDHWKHELGDATREQVLAAVRRWYNQQRRGYIPSLISLLTLVDEIRQEETQLLAQQRRSEARNLDMKGVFATATDAYVKHALDDNTALYGRLMGQLAQRTLNDRMPPEQLAAQCQAWAVDYPQISEWLSQAAGIFFRKSRSQR